MKRFRELAVEDVQDRNKPRFSQKRMIEVIDAYFDPRASQTYEHFQQKHLMKCYKLLFK